MVRCHEYSLVQERKQNCEATILLHRQGNEPNSVNYLSLLCLRKKLAWKRLLHSQSETNDLSFKLWFICALCTELLLNPFAREEIILKQDEFHRTVPIHSRWGSSW